MALRFFSFTFVFVLVFSWCFSCFFCPRPPSARPTSAGPPSAGPPSVGPPSPGPPKMSLFFFTLWGPLAFAKSAVWAKSGLGQKWSLPQVCFCRTLYQICEPSGADSIAPRAFVKEEAHVCFCRTLYQIREPSTHCTRDPFFLLPCLLPSSWLRLFPWRVACFVCSFPFALLVQTDFGPDRFWPRPWPKRVFLLSFFFFFFVFSCVFQSFLLSLFFLFFFLASVVSRCL